MSTLDELRRANIQAQKASVSPTPEVVKKPEPPAAKAAPVQAAAPPPEPETVVLAVVAAAEPIIQQSGDDNGYQPAAEITHISVVSHANGSAAAPEVTYTEEIEVVSVAYSAPVLPDLSETDLADAKKLSEFMDRLRTGIAKKSVHASGVKVTVDMAPELFWRLKRYSRDHGNPSLRQICLELVIGFLDEEGY